MKKIVYASLLFAGISGLFGLCYYLSFRNALLHYNRQAVEQNTQLLQELLESSGENERLLQQMLSDQAEEAIAAAAAQDTLRATASYFLETYYVQSKTKEREQLAVPGFMIGIDRKELGAYIEGYMETMPVNEFLQGLVSYEIVSFSPSQVVLRKTYDEGKVENQFYLCQKDDLVVVYYSDLRTVYEYTEILCSSLPEDVQEAVSHGIYVKDAQELYSMLEGYTS
ncbi:MAG: hypothetical protein J6J42_01455 [Lachnospiraceae bacterium]|nr:hypothetical protein [Lachnospiraceae bacterium]MBP3608985.1 hypothetical protein [Lachnospiraceae bacterium]